MAYAVEWSPGADEQFSQIAAKDAMLASYILDEIDRHAVDPRSMMRPPSFPHRLYPKFQFWGPGGDRKVFITVLFHLDDDLRTLFILELYAAER